MATTTSLLPSNVELNFDMVAADVNSVQTAGRKATVHSTHTGYAARGLYVGIEL